MWPFKSSHDRRIERAVVSIRNYIVDRLAGKGMMSLYLAGTILSKKERKPDSDIDFFAIVIDGFDTRLESEINKILEGRKQEMCHGFESRLRVFHIGWLQGGPPTTPVEKFLKAPRLVQRFPFFKRLWGQKIDFRTGFVPPMNLKDEAFELISQIKGNIKALREDKLVFPVDDFPKHLFELIRVEAQLFHGFKYRPERHSLVNHLKKQEGHIVHKVWMFRQKTTNRQEMLAFSNEIETYLAEFEKLLSAVR